MRALWSSAYTYYKTDLNKRYFLILLVITLTLVYFQEQFRFAAVVSKSGNQSDLQFIINWLFYAAAFIGSLLLLIPFSTNKKPFHQRGLWLTAIFAVSAFAFRIYFYQHQNWLQDFNTTPEFRFWMKCINNVIRVFTLGLPVIVFWYFMDRNTQPLYGFSTKQLKPKGYLITLLIFSAVVAIAAVEPSFQKFYPLAEKVLCAAQITENQTAYTLLFESCYGVDFVTTEFFFRGFLILAFTKYLGKQIILPAAFFYVCAHLGKPPAEAISSLFGGILLSVWVIESKSIWGGVIIHLGIAWMMELFGYLW
ncbi:MAG: CPBP family intramembrane metalloprotease [Bacteroidetes bacterium]|nr:CPBP family intramembrane metalloprotease [Bacteroidota bacterium]